MSPIAPSLQWLESYATSLHSLVLLFIVVLFMFYSTKSRTHRTLKLPPSPPKLPIVGNLYQVGPRPHRILQALALKHGSLMLLKLGPSPTLVVSSPKPAREIMTTHDLIFSNRPSQNFAKRLLGKNIGFSPYGEYWRQIKKVVNLQLLSAKRVQSFSSIREEETKVMIHKIGSSCNDVVSLSEILMSLTYNMISRVSLGRMYSGEEERGRKFRELLDEAMHLMGSYNLVDYIPWLGWVNNFNELNTRVKKCSSGLDSFIEGVVEDHIQKKKIVKVDGGDKSGKQDNLVDILLGIEKDGSSDSLDTDSIKGIILEVFVAGTGTSYTTLEFAMAELIRHPKIMKEVQEELREIARGKPEIADEDLSRMYFLQSVVKETLRLYPPAPLLLPRESLRGVKVQGYDIAAKTRVLINAWVIGRDPASWKEPNKFEPKRFMNNGINFKGHDFKFTPFGAGRRGCPGINFALATIELALANLLFQFNWRLPDGETEDDLDMDEGPGLVFRKRSPLLVVAAYHNFYDSKKIPQLLICCNLFSDFSVF